MRRINEIVEEVRFKVRDEVRVYYSQDTLAQLAKERIKKDTGLEVEVMLDNWEIEHYGQYSLQIIDYDLLDEEERELISYRYYDMEDSQHEFTYVLIGEIFDKHASCTHVDEFIGKDAEYNNLPMPVSFTKESYNEFVKMLMKG